MNRKTLARPYAKAIFSYASERESLSRFSTILKALKLLSLNKDVVRVYKDSSIRKDLLTEIVLGSLSDFIPAPSNEEIEYLKGFLKVLIKNKRFQLLDEIENLYDNYLMQGKNTIPVEVTSTRRLTKYQRKIIQEYLRHRFSKSISSKYRIDKTLVGGFLVRSSEWTLDFTLKEKLRNLTKALSK